MNDPHPDPPPADAVARHPEPTAPEVSIYTNPVSLMGFFLVALGLLLTITFALFSLVVKVSNPYLAIVGLMILPGIFGAGLVIVPVGMLIRLLRLCRDCHWSGDWTQYRGRGEVRTPTPWGIDAPGPE